MVSLRDQTIKQLRDEIAALTIERNTAVQRADVADRTCRETWQKNDRLRGLLREVYDLLKDSTLMDTHGVFTPATLIEQIGEALRNG